MMIPRPRSHRWIATSVALAAVLSVVPVAVGQSTPSVESDVAAALSFVHGPRGIAHLADPALINRMRANSDAYRAYLEDEVEALDGQTALADLDRRRLLLELAYTINSDVALPVAHRVLAQALPLVRPLSLEAQTPSDDLEATMERVLSLAYVVGGALGVVAESEDTSYAVVVLDLTRDSSEPGPRWSVVPVLYYATHSYLEAVADELPAATSVEPVAICASAVRDGVSVGYFGARTSSDAVVYAPRGPDNRFVSSTGRTITQVPPEFFRNVGNEPVPSFTSVVYPEPGETITWEILGRSASLTLDATPCREVYPDRYPAAAPPPVNEQADVRPALECVAANADGTYTAYFGYENRHGEPVTIPRGSRNRLTPASYDGQQPTAFPMPNAVPGRPGRTPFYPGHAYTVTFPAGTQVVWTLGGRTATASDDPAQRCPGP